MPRPGHPCRIGSGGAVFGSSYRVSHALHPVPCALRASRRRRVARSLRTTTAILVPLGFASPRRGSGSSNNSSEARAAVASQADAAPIASTPGSPNGSSSFRGVVWSAVAGTQAFAGQLWGSFLARDVGAAKQDAVAQQRIEASLLADVGRRAAEADDLARRQAATDSSAKTVPLLEPFLKQTGVMETRYIRKLANLCSLTYQVDKLTGRDLWRRHKMRLVTTSVALERGVYYEPPRSARQVFMEADAMAVSTAHCEDVAKDLEESQLRSSAAAARLQRLQVQRTASSSGSSGSPRSSASASKPPQSPTDIVAAKLVEAAAAAANAAAPLANNISTFTTNVVPVQSMARSMQSAAAAGHSTAVATIATVTAAIEATWAGNKGKPTAPNAANPTEWFVVDDDFDLTRYFVLMGSDSLDHWRTNLTFDPVQFEDAALGAKVHRGVYEAASLLYDRFLPLVEEHVRGNPFAKVSFTGHSLGGSIGTLLMMMYVRRGVLSPANLQTTYTFGSPAIFCEGAPACGCAVNSTTGPTSAIFPASPRAARATLSSSRQSNKNTHDGVLARLGLREGQVKNVIMHRDIVPRAFACDYSLVADLLRRVGDSFREHSCLRGPHRQAMYYFVGKVLVLQPDDRLRFVKGEGYHPSLPSKPGLWLLREPSLLGTAAAAAASDIASLSSNDVNPERREAPASVTEAVHKLMDFPHPLDILGDPEAYGNNGSISRYHDPDNICRGLASVLRTNSFWRLLPPSTGTGSPRWYRTLPAGGSSATTGIGTSGTSVAGAHAVLVGGNGNRRLPLFQLNKKRAADNAPPAASTIAPKSQDEAGSA